MGKTRRNRNFAMGGTYMQEKVEKPLSQEWYQQRKAEKKLQQKLRKLKKK